MVVVHKLSIFHIGSIKEYDGEMHMYMFWLLTSSSDQLILAVLDDTGGAQRMCWGVLEGVDIVNANLYWCTQTSFDSYTKIQAFMLVLHKK